MYDILNKIDNTKDLKKLNIKEKEELAQFYNRKCCENRRTFSVKLRSSRTNHSIA